VNKIFRMLMTVGIFAGLLAACGSSNTGNTGNSAGAPAATQAASTDNVATETEAPEATTAADAREATAAASAPDTTGGERTKVRFWTGLGGQLGEVIQVQVDKFNQSQDKVEVEVVFQQNYDGVQQKFQAALVGGDVPEIVQMEIHATPQFAASGALTPLEDFYKNDPSFNFDDLLPATLLNQSWDGKLYAMPINRSTPLLYYNKDLFRAAGLDPEQPPKTWQELREMSKKIAKMENGQTTVYGFLPMADWWIFESAVWSNGGELMSEDLKTVTFAEPGAEVMQIWSDMVHQDKTARTFTGQQAGAQQQEEFIQGRAGMLINSTAGLGRFTRDIKDFEFGTAFLPYMEGHENAVPTGGAAAAIPAAVPQEKKEAAWEFIKWWISPEQAAFWSKNTGYFPVRQSSIDILTQEGYYKEFPNYQTAIDQLEYAREAPITPDFPRVAKEIVKGVEASLINNVPAKEALTQAQQSAQELLSQ
jgi:sn-glycerol 3-phosphate transport system substrate-binding protein